MVNMALGYSQEDVAANGVVKEWVAAARNEALEETKRKAVMPCYETRHMMLGDKVADAIEALKYATPAPYHFDDVAVDRFAEAMKAKLARKRADGRGGWDDKELCSQAFLSNLLRGHVDKGDPVDVANFAMMLHQRGEAILPAPREVTPQEAARVLLPILDKNHIDFYTAKGRNPDDYSSKFSVAFVVLRAIAQEGRNDG